MSVGVEWNEGGKGLGIFTKKERKAERIDRKWKDDRSPNLAWGRTVIVGIIEQVTEKTGMFKSCWSDTEWLKEVVIC